MENRNKETNERKKKKAPKYEHRGQVVFTYLYFSHARIRAARICLINTFPACLSRGYSNFVRAGRGGNNVEISLRCSNIEKSFPFLLSPPLARIFQPITRDQKHKLQEERRGEQTALTDPISIYATNREGLIHEFIGVEPRSSTNVTSRSWWCVCLPVVEYLQPVSFVSYAFATRRMDSVKVDRYFLGSRFCFVSPSSFFSLLIFTS